MTMRIACAGAAAPLSTFAARVGDTLTAALATPRLWMRRRHDRRTLLQLDDHMLQDIGLDRVQADERASRPFWRA